MGRGVGIEVTDTGVGRVLGGGSVTWQEARTHTARIKSSGFVFSNLNSASLSGR